MEDLKAAYSELVALTQIFLLREFNLKDRISTDPQTLNFLRHSVSKAPHSLSKPVPIPSPSSQKSEPIQSPIEKLLTPLVTKTVNSNPNPVTPTSPHVETQVTIPPIKKEEKKEILLEGDKSKKSLSSIRAFTLEPMPSPTPIDCQEFKTIIRAIAPNYEIRDVIPSDAQAKKIKNNWQWEQAIPPILIIAFNDQEKQLAFLKNVAKAITAYLAPARVISGIKIEEGKQWEQILNTSGLRLIISSDYGLYALPELMKHYRETPRQAKHFLKQIPLLLLSDLSLYLRESQLKPLLWRAICTEFEASGLSSSPFKST